jgi:hypothetical protein
MVSSHDTNMPKWRFQRTFDKFSIYLLKKVITKHSQNSISSIRNNIDFGECEACLFSEFSQNVTYLSQFPNLFTLTMHFVLLTLWDRLPDSLSFSHKCDFLMLISVDVKVWLGKVCSDREYIIGDVVWWYRSRFYIAGAERSNLNAGSIRWMSSHRIEEYYIIYFIQLRNWNWNRDRENRYMRNISEMSPIIHIICGGSKIVLRTLEGEMSKVDEQCSFWWFPGLFRNDIEYQYYIMLYYIWTYIPVCFGSSEISSKRDSNNFPQISQM